MTEDELIETMARAICKRRGFDVAMIFEDNSKHSREEAHLYRLEARDALSALRAAGYLPVPVEATEEMLREFDAHSCFYSGCESSRCHRLGKCTQGEWRTEHAYGWKAAVAASPLAKEGGA